MTPIREHDTTPVEDLVESLQSAFDAGAKRLLLSMACAKDIPTIPGELFAKKLSQNQRPSSFVPGSVGPTVAFATLCARSSTDGTDPTTR